MDLVKVEMTWRTCSGEMRMKLQILGNENVVGFVVFRKQLYEKCLNSPNCSLTVRPCYYHV